MLLAFRCRGTAVFFSAIAWFFNNRSFIYVKRLLSWWSVVCWQLVSHFWPSIFVRVLRTSCMVPSPLCSRLLIFEFYSVKINVCVIFSNNAKIHTQCISRGAYVFICLLFFLICPQSNMFLCMVIFT